MKNFPSGFAWQNVPSTYAKSYMCSYCGNFVGADKSYLSNNNMIRICLCPSCSHPTYFNQDNQVPASPFGDPVGNLPEKIQALYEEIRQSMTVGAYTGAVVLCRKLLMNVAVEEGAKPNQTFQDYVNYLGSNNYVSPKGQGWVDHIRKKGNEANHEIVLMSRTDAEELINFIGMLLKFIYEFPGKFLPPVK